jgi:hypothetical protein
LWGGDSPAEITLSFGIETGGQKYDISLGTFSGIMDKTPVKLEDLIVLSLTEIKDYFVLTVNAIEENDLKNASEKVGKLWIGFSNPQKEEVYKLEGGGGGGKQTNAKLQLLRKFIQLR